MQLFLFRKPSIILSHQLKGLICGLQYRSKVELHIYFPPSPDAIALLGKFSQLKVQSENYVS